MPCLPEPQLLLKNNNIIVLATLPTTSWLANKENAMPGVERMKSERIVSLLYTRQLAIIIKRKRMDDQQRCEGGGCLNGLIGGQRGKVNSKSVQYPLVTPFCYSFCIREPNSVLTNYN